MKSILFNFIIIVFFMCSFCLYAIKEKKGPEKVKLEWFKKEPTEFEKAKERVRIAKEKVKELAEKTKKKVVAAEEEFVRKVKEVPLKEKFDIEKFKEMWRQTREKFGIKKVEEERDYDAIRGDRGGIEKEYEKLNEKYKSWRESNDKNEKNISELQLKLESDRFLRNVFGEYFKEIKKKIEGLKDPAKFIFKAQDELEILVRDREVLQRVKLISEKEGEKLKVELVKSQSDFTEKLKNIYESNKQLIDLNRRNIGLIEEEVKFLKPVQAEEFGYVGAKFLTEISDIPGILKELDTKKKLLSGELGELLKERDVIKEQYGRTTYNQYRKIQGELDLLEAREKSAKGEQKAKINMEIEKNRKEASELEKILSDLGKDVAPKIQKKNLRVIKKELQTLLGKEVELNKKWSKVSEKLVRAYIGVQRREDILREYGKTLEESQKKSLKNRIAEIEKEKQEYDKILEEKINLMFQKKELQERSVFWESLLSFKTKSEKL